MESSAEKASLQKRFSMHTAESFCVRCRMPRPPMTSSTDRLQPCCWQMRMVYGPVFVDTTAQRKTPCPSSLHVCQAHFGIFMPKYIWEQGEDQNEYSIVFYRRISQCCDIQGQSFTSSIFWHAKLGVYCKNTAPLDTSTKLIKKVLNDDSIEKEPGTKGEGRDLLLNNEDGKSWVIWSVHRIPMPVNVNNGIQNTTHL